jgi:hypothetical protein
MLRANHISQTAKSAEEAKICDFLQANNAGVAGV